MSVLEIQGEEPDEFDEDEEEEEDTDVERWRMNRDQYHHAGRLGWFNDNEKVELLDGAVYYKYIGKERGWTRKEYDQAAKLGWFDGQRVELIKGKVYVKVPQNPPHVNCIEDGGNYLIALLGSGYRVRRQSPLPLPTDGVPEPDILVVRGSQQDFLNRHPRPDEVVILIEVSDTTLHYDQTLKAAMYAEAGLDDYWLLNINNRTLEVRRDPTPLPSNPAAHAYQSVTIYTEPDSAVPLHLPQIHIPVANLLPPLASRE